MGKKMKAYITVRHDVPPYFLCHEVTDTGEDYELCAGFIFKYDSPSIIRRVNKSEFDELELKHKLLRDEYRSFTNQFKRKCRAALK